MFPGTNNCWNCESVGFYRNHPGGCADFSEDGSLLAVAFSEVLTIWDADTNGLRHTLTHNLETEPLR